MHEAGLKGFSVRLWAGLLAPAGTPRAIVDRLTQATRAAIASPAVAAALSGDGAEPGSGTAADFGRYMEAELKAWGEVVGASGAKVD